MSFHVYIARPGFKDTPLEKAQWLALAQGHSRLQGVGKTGTSSFALVSDHAQRLSLDPHGLVHAQNPSRELVALMFELADALGAGVYSEKRKRYQSVDDWEARTRSYRAQYQRRRAAMHHTRRKQRILWAVLLVAIMVVSWYVNT